MRKLNNKGAIIVLAWNFLAASVYNYFLALIEPQGLEITMVALGLTLPLIGRVAG
jgi:hypothetical protein